MAPSAPVYTSAVASGPSRPSYSHTSAAHLQSLQDLTKRYSGENCHQCFRIGALDANFPLKSTCDLSDAVGAAFTGCGVLAAISTKCRTRRASQGRPVLLGRYRRVRKQLRGWRQGLEPQGSSELLRSVASLRVNPPVSLAPKQRKHNRLDTDLDQNPPANMAGTALVMNPLRARADHHRVAVLASLANVPDLDIVQFDSAMYFVEEEEGSLTVDVIRMGTMKGTISVDYRTEDASGKAGRRYERIEGTLVFEPDCVFKTLNIPIIDNKKWASTLEFKIRLSNPKNCELGRYLFVSRVKVIDGDYFPTNTYAREFDKYGCTEQGIKNAGISSLEVLWEFISFLLSDAQLREKSIKVVAIDQLQNLYFLLTTYIVQYAADEVLQAESTDRLLFPGSKEYTLSVLAAAYLVPFAVLTWLDIWKSQQRLRENARGYMQRSIFRKYINFDELSRVSISSSEFSLTLISDADDVTGSGFVKGLELLKTLGKLAVSLYFIWAENPEALPQTIGVAVAIGVFLASRYETNAQLKDDLSKRQAYVAQVAQDTSGQMQFISDFKIRPLFESRLEQEIESLNMASIPMTTSSVINNYFPSWLSNLLTAGYLFYGGQSVMQGDVQVGTFLATVNIFKDINSTFQDIFDASLEVSSATAPAISITTLLNKQTNLRAQKKVNRRRRAVTREERRPEVLKELKLRSGLRYASDAIPIRLEKLCFAFPGPMPKVLFNCSTLSIAQGTLVAVVGPKGGGKSTLIKLLGQVIEPTDGYLFMPSYLRILHLGAQPVVLQGSLWANLTVGSKMYWQDPEMETMRVIRICKRLGVSGRLVDLLRETRDSFLAGRMSDDGQWARTLSISERMVIHLARAFVYNPEVLVMNRPTSQLAEDIADDVFEMLREFVDNRGVELPSEFKEKRRPRTAFVSFSRISGMLKSDTVWLVDAGAIREVNKKDASSYFVA